MDKFVIKGGHPLRGTIGASGSKNAALPALAAALLTAEPVILRGIPTVRDIRTMQRLLVDIGSKVEVSSDSVRIETPEITSPEAPYELVKTMRASSLVLGPLAARAGRARVSLLGCDWGRPVDLHIAGLEQLGAVIRQSPGYIGPTPARAARGDGSFRPDHGNRHRRPDDGATLSSGVTVLENAAGARSEDLADLLKMGAKIEGAGTSDHIEGVKQLAAPTTPSLMTTSRRGPF
jgi:UDP-N-acetylglucosamine 1-carboxyvinyltransferase